MKDDISLQDIQDKLKDACRETKECIKAKEIYDSCATRVNSRSKTEETCHEEMMDYVHCVDHCVSTMWSRNCSPFWSTWGHPWFLVSQSLVFCVVFCRSLFVHCPLSSGHQMYCLSFNLLPLITPFVSSVFYLTSWNYVIPVRIFNFFIPRSYLHLITLYSDTCLNRTLKKTGIMFKPNYK